MENVAYRADICTIPGRKPHPKGLARSQGPSLANRDRRPGNSVNDV